MNEYVSELMLTLLPFGYRDIEETCKALNGAGVYYRDFSEYVDNFVTDTGMKFLELDICALAYDYILQEARREIEEKTGYDICNDTDIYVYGNYMCSQFDKTEKTKNIALEIPEVERSELLKWFIDQL